MTRRILFEDLVGTRGYFAVILVGGRPPSSYPFLSSGGERGSPPDAAANRIGVFVNVIDGANGPLRVRIVLADRGERGFGSEPTLVTDLEMTSDAELLIGLEESDTGWTVLKPSLLDAAPLEVCVSVLERKTVQEAMRTLDIPSAIEIQVGDPNASVRVYEPDADEEWRDLVEDDT